MLRTLDFAERLLVVLLAIPFIVAFAKVLPMHPQYVLLAASELLGAVFILVRRPGAVAATPYAFLIAILGTALPLCARPTDGVRLVPTFFTAAVMLAGMIVTISAKLFLNRSFGIVAANRGVKRGGPYRFVRHPMYLGYFVTEIGFLGAAFSARNLVVYGLAWVVQLLRLREEERMLSVDPAYGDFSARVRFRLVPGLY